MTQRPDVVVHFKDLNLEAEIDDEVRQLIARHGDRLTDEFEELDRIEIHAESDGGGVVVHGHATGKRTNVATHASAPDVVPATDQVFAKIERQLRRAHDKRIFGHRRSAQKAQAKRQPA